MRIYNKQVFKEKRQLLRKQETPAEKILWARLRGKKLDGWHFHRQFGSGVYILDFYCPKAKLAIELDGQHHMLADKRTYDTERNQYLESLKIKTIRFWNEEVMNNLPDVLKRIASALPLKPKRESEGV